MIQPITTTTPRCFGVCCSRHHECARYLDADNAETDPHALGRCSEDESLPLFVDAKEKK